jgi:hypothetical protein
LDKRPAEIPAILANHSKEMTMKMNPTLAATLFAIMAAFVLNASAAAATPADARIEKAVAQKRMKPHSHVEEKTGIPQLAPDAMANKPHAANDRTKHFHPRDAK